MKKISQIGSKVLLHPMMSFLIMTGIVIVLSGILDAFGASVTYNSINTRTGNFESTLITVESLFSLSGMKYIFSNTVSNFIGFAPLSMLLITLIGIGIANKSGFLDTCFFLFTKKLPKTIVTFIIALTCILFGITGDLVFVIFIPLVALLYKYGKRNPLVGIVTAFAATSFGYGTNLFFSAVDSEMVNMTLNAAGMITKNYIIGTKSYLFVMILAMIVEAVIVTYVSEIFTVPQIGKYEVDEEEIIVDKEKLTKREKRGLIFALVGSIIYLLFFIWNIIPNAPLGGALLDYSQARYIDKLFGVDSFFNRGFVFVIIFFFVLNGLLYGLGAKTITNHRDFCNALSESLDGIGKVIVLLLCSSIFISLLKYTNIGSLITGLFANLMDKLNLSGIALILVLFIISILTTLVLPSTVNRWQIMSGTVVPAFMNAGITPEFTQLIFSAGSSIVYGLTPTMAYFVIYIAFLEKYDKNGMGLFKGTRYLIPYSVFMLVMWIVLILFWYFTGLPMGLGSSPII